MLVFPGWRTEGLALECRRPHWAPDPRLARYVAPPHPLSVHGPPVQIEDEYSSSSSCGSSPEHAGGSEGWVESAGSDHECTCEWVGCGVRVRGVATLSAHVARQHAHPHADGLFYCGWRACTRPHRGFNARYKMLVHVRTHTNEKPHACPQCHKCFSRAENLKIHMRSHSGEKPYVCPFQGCNKAYSNSSDRFKHTRTHAVDKPYCCKVPGCDKRYTDPSSLRKHVKTYKHFAPTNRSPSPQAISPVIHTPPPVSPVAEIYTPPPVSSVVERAWLPDSISPDERPLRPIFNEHIRVPAYDMSYMEYSRLYGYPLSPRESLHYRNYTILEGKDYVYDAAPYTDVSMREIAPSIQYVSHPVTEEPEKPLNLKCRRSSYLETEALPARPAEQTMQYELVRAMEMPLDLSNKN